MKRIVVLAFVLAVTPAAFAQLYKYVDKNGKTVYSDQPPTNVDSKQLNIPSAPGSAGSAAKSFVQRDKELDKGREKSRDAAKKTEQAAREAQVNSERCVLARNNLKTYEGEGRVQKYNADGERVFLSDEEIAAARERARGEMDEACKNT